MSVSLTVSIGDALDRYSIVEIKSKCIKDEEKLREIGKEMELLRPSVQQYIEKVKYYYDCLVKINQEIWNDLDTITTENSMNKDELLDLYKIMWNKNHQRYRLKRKINLLSNSELKEEKGYEENKCLILGHLGLGDILYMIGAVRYLSTKYDKLIVVCKKQHVKNLELFYGDDESINILPLEQDFIIHNITYFRINLEKINNAVNSTVSFSSNKDVKEGDIPRKNFIETFKLQNYDIFSCGFHKHGNNMTPDELRDIPNNFYRDFGLPITHRQDYFYIPKTEECINLYNKLKYLDKPYIFVHDTSSYMTLSIGKELKDEKGSDYIIINPNQNLYENGEPYYNLCQEIIEKPLTSYISIIENAKEIHAVDSSFMCMIIGLDLSNVKVLKCYPRDSNFSYEEYSDKGFDIVRRNWD